MLVRRIRTESTLRLLSDGLSLRDGGISGAVAAVRLAEERPAAISAAIVLNFFMNQIRCK
jgi:hypothetical protein